MNFNERETMKMTPAEAAEILREQLANMRKALDLMSGMKSVATKTQPDGADPAPAIKLIMADAVGRGGNVRHEEVQAMATSMLAQHALIKTTTALVASLIDLQEEVHRHFLDVLGSVVEWIEKPNAQDDPGEAPSGSDGESIGPASDAA